MENRTLIATLNELIETCKDGEQGFKDAADAVKDSHLRATFVEISRQRSQFAAQLQNEVSRLGGEPDTGGHVTGALHRGWMNLRAAISSHEEGPVVKEAERREDAAVKAYELALKANLPTHIRTIVEGQYNQVKDAHDRVRSLEIQYTR